MPGFPCTYMSLLNLVICRYNEIDSICQGVRLLLRSCDGVTSEPPVTRGRFRLCMTVVATTTVVKSRKNRYFCAHIKLNKISAATWFNVAGCLVPRSPSHRLDESDSQIRVKVMLRMPTSRIISNLSSLGTCLASDCVRAEAQVRGVPRAV